MKKEKSTRRKEQGDATKKRIYEAAQKLFTEHGIDSVSVDDIVQEVGVARGTFYVHFESKDMLISSLISDYVSRVDLDYENYVKTLSPDTPTQEVLILAISKICDVIEHTFGCEIFRTLYRVQLTGAHVQETAGYNRTLYQLLASILQRGIDRGEFQGFLPAETLSRHLVLAMRGLVYEWCIRYPDFNFKEQILEHFTILLEGIKQNTLS
ncbi:AcrR family transcriptional regulator [Anaerotaenia torta]|uniref:TetR/AcrR family transcriptional regulator n=1 Tax=Anaerotaenia torta TaxID=433293 RepID=UPI003D22DC9F